MARWLLIGATTIGVIVAGGYAALKIGGPDLIYPRVAEPNFGPASITFIDTDPGPTIGGTATLGRAPDEKGVDMYMVHWGLEVANPGVEDDPGKGDHGGRCKGFRDTNHVVMAHPTGEAELKMEIPQGTVVPADAVYLVGHTIYGGIHNLAKCVQIPIVNRVD